MTPGEWIFVLGHGNVSHIVEMLNFFKIIDQTNKVYCNDDQGSVYQSY